MPQGLGKLERKFRARFPRIARFYGSYDHTIQAILIAAFVSLVAYVGVSATQKANDASETAKQANREVKVFRQASPCLTAKEHPTKKNLARCHKSFGQAVALVTPLQACRLIQKGATLLVINGRRVQGIECKFEAQPKRPDDSSAPSAGSGSQPSSGATSGPGQHGSGSGSGGSNGKHTGSKTKQQKPSSTTAPSPAPAPVPTAPVAEDHPGNSETGKGKAKGQEGIAVELKPSDGGLGKVEVFPGQLPVESCNPVVSLNC